ncbi:hypothetical protein RHMOL_Rhmol12G0229600 [Rhododendron molle]|uniref:Uncharacterized protein n=1 Tax=Rhododendron molle TaxID=49168 RepID=A0ACC0LMB9_RHOML|nr:hypothetical protein RHMOL_Rhmol12G0229600 [Rhododendron molle]
MGVDNIMVGAMGGRSVILTCNNKRWKISSKSIAYEGGSLKLNHGRVKQLALKDLFGCVAMDFLLMVGATIRLKL